MDFLKENTAYLLTLASFLAIVVKYHKSIVALLGVAETIEKMNKKIEKIDYELEYNGNGSTKDATKRIEEATKEIKLTLEMITSRDDFKFRKEKYPAFECDLQGRNLRVSNAYLHLLQLRVGKDLNSVDWAQFIDVADRERYFNHFKEQASTKSDFEHPAKFYNKFREYVGKWDIQAAYIKGGIYFGIFIPIDDTAKAIFEKNKWILP